jgi:small subunit ribosomal protein S1
MRRTLTAAAVGAIGASAFIPHPAGPMRASTSLRAGTAYASRFEKISARWKGPRIEQAPEEAAAYADFQAEIEKQDYPFEKGSTVEGTVVQFEYQGALVDIGAKSSAFLPLREAALIPADDVTSVVSLDEGRDFMIISEENEDGQLTVSIRRIEFQKAWDRVLELQAEDAHFEAEVLNVNRGGAIVTLEGLRAFLPGSHLCGAVPTEALIGTKLPLKFLEVNQESNKLVVSHRRAVVEQQMRQLSRGDVVQGVVKALKPYGAFVEIGGMSGLLHISQISYDRIENLEKVLEPNMAIKCMIIDHDKVNGRIALSTKTLEPEPGDMLKDAQRVFDLADDTAAKYHQRMESERKAREETAKDIVMGLGDVEGGLSADPLAGVELETVLDGSSA